MKTLQLSMIMALSFSVIFLITSQHAFADTCSARLTSYNAPQFYLLSDGVFAGTVQHIDNATDHQWKVYFTVDKLWRGSISQKPLMVMTNDLQGCGYSIVQGEKYLVYTNGYPPFFNIVWSKPYTDAQSDIAIIDDPKFQSNEKTQEELNKKLVIARDAISNLMGSKMGDIPFNGVGVDEINSTLDVEIDSAKATLSEAQYLKKIKAIVGDIPIKITFGQNQLTANNMNNNSVHANSTSTSVLSPLKQFKSGIKAEDVKCKEGLKLVMKSENNSPACVKPDTADNLIKRGWAQPTIIPSKKVHEILPLIPNDTVKSSVNPDNQTSSTLKLFISTDSTYTSPGNPVGVDVSLNNTSSTPLILTKSDNWPRNDLSSGPCSNLPFGMAILKGYYIEQNMSNANSLVIFQNIPCPLPAKIKSYTFQPLSSKATQECDSLFSCTGLVDMKTHLEISGFVDNNSSHHPFSIGTYTIIAGDQWGHVAIQHFSEAYTTPLANLKGN